MPTRAPFTLDDFIAQMNQVQELGPMGKVMSLLPGMKDMLDQVGINEHDIAHELARMRAMYASMTPAERANPDLVDAPRRRRIARGAGVTPTDVAKFLLDFDQSRAVMRAVGQMGVMSPMKSLRDQTSPKLTLGLVTSNRHHPDPSDVRKDSRPRHPLRVAFLIALAATASAALLFTLLH